MSNQAEQFRSVYAQMMDGELLDLASDMDNLTEVARPLLGAELKKRGLDVAEEAPVHPVVLSAAEPPDDDEQLIPIPEYEGKCPKCGSVDIIFLEREEALSSEPDINEKFYWICDSCQHEWSDDGMQAQ